MSVELFFLLYLGFLCLVVIYNLWLKPKTTRELLEEAINDIKENKTVPLTRSTWADRMREERKWAKAHPVHHFIKECGWWIRHIWGETLEFPRNAYRTIRRGYQRGYYGWAHEDTWSLNNYIAKVVLESIKHLNSYAGYGHGLLLRTSETYDHRKDIGPDNDPDMDYDVKESKRIVKEILWAWNTTLKCTDGRRYFYHPSFNRRKDKKHLSLAEEKRRIEGLNLWIKHYHSLCD